MTISMGMVTADTLDALALGRWWAEVTGGTVLEENDGWFVVVGIGDGQPRLGFQKVDDPTPGKNRLHLDLVVSDDLDAEVSRFVAAGATVVGERSMGDFRWVTLADPDGNQLCLAAHES